MKKERIESLKFMRVVAMMLVVLIHTTAVAITTLEPSSPFYPIYLFLNRFTRFEGPVFVFLSGVVLFYNYEGRPFTKETWLGFYKKRFLYILCPYLVWSLFYESYSYYMGFRSYEGITIIIKNLLLGQSFYQLYFILILVQLYFLLPIFIFLIKRFPLIKKYLFIIGFLLEYIFQVLNHAYHWVTLPFFMVYISSFLLGGWVGVHYSKVKKLLTKNQYIIYIFSTIMLGVIYTYLFFYQNILKEAIMPYFIFKVIAMLYYLVACYVLFKVSLLLEQRVSAKMDNLVENLRIYSFGFYLVHPFILNVWERILVPESVGQFHFFILLRYICVVISCYIFIRTLHHLFPRAWFLFGKLPTPRKDSSS